ncbi:SHO1 [Phaffia rhodozyma]|uniref:SHO1 n=1 Tax=Phaffia rhodozyma TaxID=264483 RepID=A0A0F7SEA5_PHARH|nr:SHO1 [Phaffia rhodozyma]
MPGRTSFSFQPFLTHYILLITWALAVIGWFVAFIGMAVGEAQRPSSVTGSLFETSWFGIFCQLGVMVGLFIGIATDSLPLYQLQLCTFGAVALVFAVFGANNIFGSLHPQQAAGAGWLILAIVDIFWLLYLTSEKPTVLNHLLNSNAVVHGPQLVHPSGSKSLMVPQSSGSNLGNHGMMPNAYANNQSSSTAHINQIRNSNLRSSTNTSGYPGGESHVGDQSQDVLVGSSSTPLMQESTDLERGDAFMPPKRAKALYAYQASPDDPQEMSFLKGEILEISDNTGKWWQARKHDGTTGICPSNYLQLLP